MKASRELLPFALVVSLTAAAVTTTSSCAPPPEPPLEENVEPVARLVWPQRWTTQEPAPFDASASDDEDGLLERVTLSFGDGTPDQDRSDGIFEHLYTAPGSYDVRLEVVDDVGAFAEVVGTVVVVDRIDDPPCSCDLPCFDDAVCTEGGCFLAGVSEDGDVDGGAEAPLIEGEISCP